MQVTFLLYHYFEATEAYNAIRVFIAGYVWMTGYGNFHYYYRTKDFCIGRFAQMMWRLNFLVAVVCIVMRNDYMLYYICPMHTLFTVLVYAPLAIYPELNDSRLGMGGKMLACGGLVAFCWELPAVFYALWTPLEPPVGYLDPRKSGGDPMHGALPPYRSNTKYCTTYTCLLGLKGVVVGDVGLVQSLQRYNTCCCYGLLFSAYCPLPSIHVDEYLNYVRLQLRTVCSRLLPLQGVEQCCVCTL